MAIERMMQQTEQAAQELLVLEKQRNDRIEAAKNAVCEATFVCVIIFLIFLLVVVLFLLVHWRELLL